MIDFKWLLRSCCALASPAGHQVSQRLAEEAKKRERFEELRQQLELDQEVRGSRDRNCLALRRSKRKTMLKMHEVCSLIYTRALSTPVWLLTHFSSETVPSYDYKSVSDEM